MNGIFEMKPHFYGVILSENEDRAATNGNAAHAGFPPWLRDECRGHGAGVRCGKGGGRSMRGEDRLGYSRAPTGKTPMVSQLSLIGHYVFVALSCGNGYEGTFRVW